MFEQIFSIANIGHTQAELAMTALRFLGYLEARGVDAGLARYIMEVHIDKEQKEYTRWLENVSNFVSKGASK